MLTDKIKRSNTILYCKNWEMTVRFYRDVLKFAIYHESEWFVEFQIGENAYLSIADAANASVNCANGAGITLSWQVENLDKIHGRFNQLDIKTSPIKPVWGSRAFYVFDPEGHRIELWS